MRRLLVSVLVVVLLVGCRAPAAPNATPAGNLSAPVATPLPTLAPSPTSEPTPAPSPTPQAVEGPLAVEGMALRGLVMGPGSLRYGLLKPGLARSEDGGRTWQRVSSLDLPLPIVAGADGRTLYAGKMRSCYMDEDAVPMRRSQDGGETWEVLPEGAGMRPVAVAPGEPGTVYAIDCRGLNLSRDGGATWQNTGPTMGMDITSIIPVGRGSMFLFAVLTSEGGSSHPAWFSSDGTLERNLYENLNFWALGVLAGDGANLYLADSQGVRRSRDAGTTWSLFTAGLDDVVLPYDPMTEGVPADAPDRAYGLFALSIDPANPHRLALGTIRGLYISEDAGETWSLVAADRLGQSKITGVAWEAGTPGTLWVTADTGVYIVRLPES